MKTENNKQKEVVVQNNLKIKLMVVGITAISMFALAGCHSQMAAVQPLNLNSPVFVNETNLEPVPALLTSKITLNEGCQSNSNLDHKNIELSTLDTNLGYQYLNTSMRSNLELAKESWRNTYEGKGIPLLKISF